jgi:hypothetical protein
LEQREGTGVGKPYFFRLFLPQSFFINRGSGRSKNEHEFSLKPDPDIFYAGLIYDGKSRAALGKIYRGYLQVAQDYDLPILLMTNTRRANRERLGRSAFRNLPVMRDYAHFLKELAADYRCEAYIGGMLGCKGDAYRRQRRHLPKQKPPSFISGSSNSLAARRLITFCGYYALPPEAKGMAKVMEQSGLPYIISLMTTPGRGFGRAHHPRRDFGNRPLCIHPAALLCHQTVCIPRCSNPLWNSRQTAPSWSKNGFAVFRQRRKLSPDSSTTAVRCKPPTR